MVNHRSHGDHPLAQTPYPPPRPSPYRAYPRLPFPKHTYYRTRMHSSRMRTGCLLTIFRSLLLLGGVLSPGGCLVGEGHVWSQGGMSGLGACLAQGGMSGLGGLVQGGCVWSVGVSAGQVLPPVNRMTDRCKNITLATTSLRPVNKSASRPLAFD